MRNLYYGAPFVPRPRKDRCTKVMRCGAVEAGKRLIQNNDRGISHEHTCDCHASPLTAGELLVRAADEGVLAEREILAQPRESADIVGYAPLGRRKISRKLLCGPEPPPAPKCHVIQHTPSHKSRALH